MAHEEGDTARPICFIIGPIGDRLAARGTAARTNYEESIQMWEEVFEPVCDSIGLKAIRADKITESGEIPEQVFLHLRDAPVVIADVTRGNANVMYELGLRHTRNAITVQIGENELLPFDIASIRTIKFKRTAGGLVEARDQLEEFLRTALTGSGRPVTATRVWNEARKVDEAESESAVAASNRPEVDIEVDEPGFIEVLAEGEDALGGLARTLESATDWIKEVGATIGASGEAIVESDARKGGFAGRLQVARRLAADLDNPATELEASALDYAERVTKFDAMVQYLLDRVESGEGEASDIQEFAESLITLVDAAEGSDEGIRNMIGGTRTVRGIARDLVPVSKRIEASLNRFLTGTTIMVAWKERLMAVRDAALTGGSEVK